MCVFHRLQVLYGVCVPQSVPQSTNSVSQSTRTIWYVCSIEYSDCMMYAVHRVQGLYDVCVPQCSTEYKQSVPQSARTIWYVCSIEHNDYMMGAQSTRVVCCVCFTEYEDCILCVPQSMKSVWYVCFTECKDCTMCVFHRVQGLYDMHVPQSLYVVYVPQSMRSVLCMCSRKFVWCICSTEYKDWWMPKVEEVMVDKNRAKKQTTPGAAPVASDEKVSCSPHYLIVFISKCTGKPQHNQWSGLRKWIAVCPAGCFRWQRRHCVGSGFDFWWV